MTQLLIGYERYRKDHCSLKSNLNALIDLEEEVKLFEDF